MFKMKHLPLFFKLEGISSENETTGDLKFLIDVCIYFINNYVLL